MTAPRTLRALVEDWPQPVPQSERNSSFDPGTFELLPRPEWTTSLIREASKFLDGHDTSHPFQWPQWSADGALIAMLRSKSGEIRWFAQCGVMYPASSILRPIRALSINRGPVCDDLEVLEAGLGELIEQAGKMKCCHVDILPEWTGAFAGSAAEMLARTGWQGLPQSRSSLRLSLEPSVDDLLSSFRKTTRYEIRRALEAGMDVSVAQDDDEYHEFLRLHGEMARQRNFSADKPDFLLAIFRWLASEPQRGGLFLARESGKLRGGALVIRSGTRSWYVLGATSKEGKIGAGHLLQWCAIQWAKRIGCGEYDFGGYREGATSGPALFKKGFCDRVAHFILPHRFIVNRRRYGAAEILGKVRHQLRPRR